jgi:tRNA-dihydrouridine synthase A
MLVGDCVAAMKAAVPIPVTVKCRIGIDEQDPELALESLAASVEAAGVDALIVHARKAWLKGLSPRENRELPPLDYERVFRLKATHRNLPVVLNGGVATVEAARGYLTRVDGVMMGRAAYQNPALLADVDARFFGEPDSDVTQAVDSYLDYVAAQLAAGVPLNAMTKHMLGLFHGQPGARLFRRHLSENATKKGAGLAVLQDAMAFVRRERAEAA